LTDPRSASPSHRQGAFCIPEDDPFLLPESMLRSIEEILRRSRGVALRRTWIEQPYDEEEITILEEEVIPAIQQCLSRVDDWRRTVYVRSERLLPLLAPSP
jgi:hypothetical protein